MSKETKERKMADSQQMAKMRQYAQELKRKKPSITYGKLARAVQRKFGVQITDQ